MLTLSRRVVRKALVHSAKVLVTLSQRSNAKVIAVRENLAVVYEDHVSYDKDLPEFGTVGGVHIREKSVTAPSAMFVKALDMLLDKMVKQGFDFGTVVAIAGASQQSGSVYWKHGARQKLKHLEADRSMYDQLKDEFSTPDSPTWMDASATQQCRQLEQAVGGAMEMAKRTGSRAFESCTAPAILKLFQTQREAYDNTERISLISSFLASMLIGDYAPTDFGGGSMLKLLDIGTKQWFTECVIACGEDVVRKIGELVPAQTILGNVSSYLVQKYKFSAHCKVIAFTGDTLQSLVGVTARKDEVIFTLGTADCLMRVHSLSSQPNLISMTLVSSLDPGTLVTILSFKNGSLTRQHIMERCAGCWENFSELFSSTPPGNNGYIGIYVDLLEKMHVFTGNFRFNEKDEKVVSFPPEVEVRAVVEGQLLERLLYARKSGLRFGPEARIIATGGASANKTILQAIADVFNTPVYTMDVTNSASLGGCYRAKMAVEGASLDDIAKHIREPVSAAMPTAGLEKLYEDMLARYEKLEEKLTAEFEAK